MDGLNETKSNITMGFAAQYLQSESQSQAQSQSITNNIIVNPK
jgi:hypothetical protein